MAKFTSKLPKKEVEKILYQLCVAISGFHDPKDVAEFLGDLLSFQESEMIAKRLKIAESLIGEKSYEDIQEELKVSPGTIARVQEWLKISGNGYRRAVERVKKNGVIKDEAGSNFKNWSMTKRKYPMYYWPEILLENIIQGSSAREKKRIGDILEKLEASKEKTDLYRKLKRLMVAKRR